MDEIRSLLEALEDASRREEAIERLAALGPQAVPWVSLRLGSRDFETRRAVVEVLVRIGPPAVDCLCEQLRLRFEPDQLLAAQALGRIGDRRAVVPLCGLLWSRSDNLIIAAADALGQIGDLRPLEQLNDALPHPNQRVRIAVIRALEAIGSDVADALLTALERRRDSGWCDVADALVEWEDHRVIGPLREALADENVSVRCTAATGLGRLGDVDAIPGLCALLRDPDGYVREAAGTALGLLAQTHPTPKLCEALPALDRLSRVERVLPWEERTFARVALSIRSVTANLAERPIPASGPELIAGGLPVPAAATGADVNDLPIAGDTPAASDHVSDRRGAWWRTLLRQRE